MKAKRRHFVEKQLNEKVVKRKKDVVKAPAKAKKIVGFESMSREKIDDILGIETTAMRDNNDKLIPYLITALLVLAAAALYLSTNGSFFSKL